MPNGTGAEPDPAVRLSVVVPTYNRRELVLEAVTSIAAARRPWPCELIVVVDGSTDGTAESLRLLDLGIPTTVLEQPNSGAATARNAGAAAARGEFLLFVDDDMVVDEALLVEHERTLALGADAVVGHIRIDHRSPRNLLTRGVERWAEQRRARLARSGGRLGVADFLTGQLSVRTALFRRVGGFDGVLTAAGTFGGEDTDLVYRLLQAGADLRFNAAAVSAQRYVVRAPANLRQWAQAGRSDALLSRKHPGLGAVLHANHGGRTLVGRLAQAVAALPPAVTRVVADRVARRVDGGRTDAVTGYAFALVRDIAYWGGARANGGLRTTSDSGVRILAYHAVEEIDDPRIAQYSVTPRLFEEQIETLLAAGRTFISAGDLIEHLDGRPLPPGSTLLTFDDAYESVALNAAPVLERHGIPAVICVVSDEIGGHNAWDAETGAAKLPLLTRRELAGLRAAGWAIASHTRRHAHLPALPTTELAADLRNSRAALAEAGLGTPELLAYPYGEHDARVRAQARDAGFTAAFALTTRRAHPAVQDRYALARIEVRSDTTPADLLHLVAEPMRTGRREDVRRELRGRVAAWLRRPVLDRLRRGGAAEVHPSHFPQGAPEMTTAPAPTGVWCCEFELSSDGPPSSVVPVRGEPEMRVLVRLHGEPVGYVNLPCSGSAADVWQIRRAVWQEFGDVVAAHLAAEDMPMPATPDRLPTATPACPNHVTGDDLVSVVVCTRDRSASLPACLDRLAAIEWPAVEFVIVDNAPSDDSTAILLRRYAAADPRFRYVRESRPGLSWARNAGLVAARGRYLAYTDDDVAVDSRWVHGLMRGFRRRPDVACVTGLVCTAAITNAAEAYFDARLSSWSTRCRPQLFDMSTPERQGVLYPFSAGVFGTGASFAFDRARLARLGGFDEALGAGTATRGGEDLDVFVRMLLDGGAIAYEPSAVVWHHHRADEQSLLRQMYGYGTGLTAYLTKLLLHRSTRLQVLRRVPAGVLKIAQIKRQTEERLTDTIAAPSGAVRREFAGYLAGPVLYARARRAVHTSRRKAVTR